MRQIDLFVFMGPANPIYRSYNLHYEVEEGKKKQKGLNYGFMSNVNHDKKRPKYNIPCLSFYYIANLTYFNGS